MESRPWTKFYPPNALAPLELKFNKLSEIPSYVGEKFGNKPALTFGKQIWSFLQLKEDVCVLAKKLRKSGVTPGARVAILLPNLPEYIVALFAIWSVDATAVQINSAYVAAEIERILEHSGPLALITNSEQITKLKQESIILCATLFEVQNGQFSRVSEPRGTPYAERSSWPDQSTDIALLQYTGGTMGFPKSVMLTHKNILSNIEQRLRVTLNAVEIPENASVINTLPMCHVYGLTCVALSSVFIGMNQVIIPRFSARPVLQTIKTERPFVFYGVPTMYAAFLREPDLESFGLDKVRIFNSAGASMPQAHSKEFHARTGAHVLSGFGITEASPSTHTYPDYIPRREGSSGIPIPYTDVRVVRTINNVLIDVPTGEVGELLVRGPQIMRGYWSDPKSTREALRSGWLHTGDLVRVDQDGYLYVIGREKDVIIASGYNVYPVEIERVIGAIPNVAEVAVVGVADEYRGETVKAFVVAVPGSSLVINEIYAQCKRNLSPIKVPSLIEIVDDLPRTAVGKIDKRALAENSKKIGEQ